MNELIKITETDGVRLINARDLHESLQVGKFFANWIKDRIEKYGFVEGEDFFKKENLSLPNSASSKGKDFLPNLAKNPIEAEKQQNLGSKKDSYFFPNLGKNRGRGRPEIEYFLTLDTAKELAMVENNEAGKEIRRYLIAVEKKYREIAVSGENKLIEMNTKLDLITKELLELKKGQLQVSGQPEITDPETAMLCFGGKFLEVTGKESDVVEAWTLYKVFKRMFKVEMDSHTFMNEMPYVFTDIYLDTRRKYKPLFRGCLLK